MVFLYFYNLKVPDMNLIKKPIFFLLLASLVLPNAVSAQYRWQVNPLFSYLRDLERYEIGGTYVMPSSEFAGVTRAVGAGGSFLGDTTLKRAQTGTGIGGSIGLSLPFKATGHISCWAMSLHLMFNQYTFTDINKNIELDGTFTAVTPMLSATTTQIALPIGIDWKAGTDAIKTKRLKFGTSLGAGFIPQFNMTSMVEPTKFDAQNSFGFTPYLKAEGALFAGMCLKLRLIYTMGNITFIDVARAVPGYNDGPYKITSTGNVMLSFIIMPFSAGWGETHWYNTYDTYNQHDRLN